MCLMEAKVVGVMRMIDQGEGDDKIIAVAKSDMSVSHYNDISELPHHMLDQIHRFFQDYKKLEKKEVQVLQFEGKERGYQTVKDAIELYKTTFGKT
jgi:inorganic pyrophosphatase